MKIAIVHDWLTNMGGAENIIKIFTKIFPDAPVYTMVYNKKRMERYFDSIKVIPSFIQKMPFGVGKYTAYLPLMPLAAESFDLSDYDVVISSSTSCAKGVLTRADTLHICYCNTPMRYAWDFYFDYIKGKNIVSRTLISWFMHYIRLWDVVSSNRVDYFIANSYNVGRRIEKHYRRTSDVIYPPVNVNFYTPEGEPEDYYLIVSRLVSYKRIDIAVKAFNELGLPLVIIGEGNELKALKELAKGNIKFLGRLSNEEVREYYRKCKAFIFSGEEDFGITPLEAQACGRPVIAYGKGGALETVVDGKTGLFFGHQDKDSLIEAVKRFEKLSFDSSVIRKHAEQFDEDVFIEKFKNYVNEKYEQFRKRGGTNEEKKNCN